MLKADSIVHAHHKREKFNTKRFTNSKNKNSWEYQQSLPQLNHQLQSSQNIHNTTKTTTTTTTPSDRIIFTSLLTDSNNRRIVNSVPPDSAVITQTQLRQILSNISLPRDSNHLNPNEISLSETRQNHPEFDEFNDESRIRSNAATSINDPPTNDCVTVKAPPRGDINQENVLSENTIFRMSLLDQKRLQWAKEKAQMETEWNPWGRPGCGAPLMIGSGTRKPSTEWSTSTTPPLNSPHSSKVIGVTDTSRLLPPLAFGATYTKATSVSSSIGNALVSNLSTMLSGRDNETIQIFPDENNVVIENIPDQIRLRTVSNNNSHNAQIGLSEDEKTVASSFPAVNKTAISPVASTEAVSATRSFLRGANIPLDPETKAELELKRRKQREQQLAIQAQLEEKQKRIQQEKERIRREELREEQHLALIEQQQIIEDNVKQETQEKNYHRQQQELLRMIEEKNKRDASNVKEKSDRIEKEKQLLAEKEPRESNVKSETNVDVPEETVSRKSQETNINKADLTRETPPPAVSPYIVNRVLTPTKYRGTQTSPVLPPREFGTQTDSSLSRKKDVGIDTENIIEPKINRRTKSDGKTSRKKIDRDQDQHRPNWGAHQSDKSYQKQSEKELSRRRLQEMRQKRLEEEAMIQCGQPQVGSGKRRSSARHQRHLLIRETGTPLSLTPSHRSASPRLLLSHQSSIESVTAYDSNVEGSTRRPRRQWESPRTDEIPNFYTQPLNLAGRRNSRSLSSQSTDTTDARSPVKGNHDLYPRIMNAPGMTSWNSAVDVNKHSEPILKTRMRSLENVRVTSDKRETEGKNGLLQYEKRKDNWVEPITDNRYSAGNADFIPYSRSSVSLNHTYTLATRSAPQQQNKILQQLSTIRQGLLMKQQQIEHYLNKNNYANDDNSDSNTT